MTLTLPEVRFWGHVKMPVNVGNDDCWLWTGTADRYGYGKLWVRRAYMTVHRFSYELHVGKLGKFHCLHSCRNRNCVNPRHLRAGTHQENMADRVVDGTLAKGERQGGAVLTETQVLLIFYDPRTQRAIANSYHVAQATIWKIKAGRSWGWLTRTRNAA